MDVIASNKALKDGTLGETINSTMDRVHPEATYFTTIDGCRACIMVFELHDPSEIPSISEPFFVNLNAKVEFSPVMNAEDLKKGLEMSSKSFAMAL
jgi:hypothetical protein